MDNGKNTRNFALLVLIVISVLAVLASLFYIYRNSNSEFATVAYVDGQPVARGEIIMEMERNRAYVIGYFQEKYGADVSEKDFWNKKYGNEMPAEFMKQLALDNLVKVKVQQSLALKHNIVADVSYKGMLKSMKTENERRAEAIDNGEVVMGNSHYGKYEYFQYSFDDSTVQDQSRCLCLAQIG